MKAVYAYNKNGQPVSIIGENTGIRREYNNMNRLSVESNALTGHFLRFDYDNLGRRIKRTDHLGRITQYSYDSESRLTAITSPDNKTVSFLYDKRGRRTKRINPNGTYAEYNYSGSRLAGITHKKSSGTVFLSYSYTYDNAGNIIKITGADETKNYSYDQTYRLIRADYVSASGTTNLIEEFSYDPAGNMIEYKKNGVVTVMQYDADDKLVSDTEFNYAYDLAGKLRQKIRKSDNTVSEAHDYGWDNRTAKISAENKVFEYQYDVLGRRISKTENNIATSILFDGDNAYQGYNASGEKTAEYMFSERIDEPLLMTKGGQEYTYHQNHLGTVMGLTGEDENLVNEYEYTAYGMDRGSAEIVDQLYQYTAREKIGDTGLHYYRSRVIRSGNGAFTRSDDTMDGVNWRGYVRGRPINFRDPTGNVTTCDFICAAITVVTVTPVCGLACLATGPAAAACTVFCELFVGSVVQEDCTTFCEEHTDTQDDSDGGHDDGGDDDESQSDPTYIAATKHMLK